MDTLLQQGLIVLVAVVVLFLFARLVTALRATEQFKQFDIRYGLIVKAVTDAIFAAEVADPEIRAMYEEKAAQTGYNIKMLIVFDRVEAFLRQYGIRVDLETEVAPIVERLLIERPEFPNKVQSKVIEPPPFKSLDDARVAAAALLRQAPR